MSAASTEDAPTRTKQHVAGYKFGMASASSMLAEGVTYPFDLAKTRLQLQEAGKKATISFFGMARHIVAAEGIPGLYWGLTPALARHMPYTGFRAVGYEHVRDAISGSADGGEAPFLAKAAAAMAAGGLGQAIAAPLDLLKVRMQGDKPVARPAIRPIRQGELGDSVPPELGLVADKALARPRYGSLGGALAAIAKNEGVLGFWVGSGPAIQRACLVNVGELATYDAAKRYAVRNLGLSRDDTSCHALAAACSGLAAALLSAPADLAKSRIMNQKTATGLDRVPRALHYKGTLDCWENTARGEGFFALYRGFFATWFRLAPWQLIFWITYERLRISTGIGSFK